MLSVTTGLPMRTSRKFNFWREAQSLAANCPCAYHNTISISGEIPAPLPPLLAGAWAVDRISFNLRRDPRSLATLLVRSLTRNFCGVSISGEIPAPLPPQQRRGCTERKHCVSISGEIPAPLPHLTCMAFATDMTRFNLRRDPRSLATAECRYRWRLPAMFQSQARSPLPCHLPLLACGYCRLIVSISGEIPAPLPL